ncbi:hypothetical protein BGZ95_003658, partial [Linnemannia exigua]
MTSGPSSSSPVPVPPKKVQATDANTQLPPLSVSVPLQNTSAAASAAEPSVLTSSSPVYSRAHPFLRKFQTTVQKAVAQQQQQNQSVLSSAFSTSAAVTSSSNDNDNSHHRKSVDERIAAVSGGSRPSVNRKSPTLAAAKAADAIIQKRLDQARHDGHHGHEHTPSLDESIYTEETFE